MEYYIIEPITFLLRYLQVFAEFILIFALINRKIEIKKIALTSIIGVIVVAISKTSLPQYVISLLYPVMFILILKIVYKEKLFTSFAVSLISMIIVTLVDCIVSHVTITVCNLDDFSQIINNIYIYTFSCLSMTTIIFMMGVFIYYSRSNNLFTNIEKSKNITIFITLITTFILLVPNLVILLYSHDKKTIPFGIVFINICAIVILFFVNMYNTKNNIKLAKSEQDLIAQQKYSKTQQDLIDGLRQFKHDYSNTLQTLRGYVEYNKIDKLKEMFKQVLDETKAITTLDKLNPNTIKDPGLFGILTGKYQKAKDNKIRMEIEIFGDIEDIDIEIFDLTRMLGILLDNAIEAAKESKEKRLMFMLTERKNEVSFEISNTFSGEKIELEKIKQKGVSTKGKDRGLGLAKVEEIVSKYRSVRNTTQVEKDKFIQIITISKKRNEKI